MLSKLANKTWFYPVLILLAIILDQASKLLFLRLSIASLNQDLAFSVSFSNPLVLNIAALLIFCIGLYYFARSYTRSTAFALVVAGGLSNIIDRIFRHGVVDFINLKIWPSFNVADSFITIGSILILYSLVKGKTRP